MNAEQLEAYTWVAAWDSLLGNTSLLYIHRLPRLSKEVNEGKSKHDWPTMARLRLPFPVFLMVRGELRLVWYIVASYMD